MLDIALFLGRFHPLIVHLPIGFLLMAGLLLVAASREKWGAFIHAVPFTLLLGTAGAVIACITGYLLSLHGDYEEDPLNIHMLTGIVTALVSFLTYLLSRKKIAEGFVRVRRSLLLTVIIMLAVVFLTGHLGATLTHGPDYISTDVLFEKKRDRRNITSANDALIFEDIVQPILNDKCAGCHGRGKKKGRLSLLGWENIEKGGKHGKVIVAGQPAASEMIKRVSLDPKDEKFMPSDGKPPLSADETDLLKWWIGHATRGEDASLAAMRAPPEILQKASVYLRLQDAGTPTTLTDTAVFRNIPPLKNNALETLQSAGFAVKYLHRKPDLLDVTLLTGSADAADVNARKVEALLAVKDNVVWLNMAGAGITDTELGVVSTLKNLRRLTLSKNPLTDRGIRKLVGLTNLQSLNVYATSITKACLPDLSSMEQLKTVYAWGTDIRETDLGVLNDSSLTIVLGH